MQTVLTNSFQFTTQFQARLTGVIGLLLLISGSFAHYVNSKLIVIEAV